MKRLALASLLSIITLSAFSAPIYRCGNTYSQTPCAGATVIETDDSRSAAQWVEAKAVAADERRLGREMERERLIAEARAPSAATALSAPRLPIAPRAAIVVAKRTKLKQRRIVVLDTGSDFVAVAPKSAAR